VKHPVAGLTTDPPTPGKQRKSQRDCKACRESVRATLSLNQPIVDDVSPNTAGSSFPPRGMTAIGIFLLFGSATALLAGISLVRPGTTLDHLWALNPHAYKQLAPLGRTVGPLFLLLSALLGIAGTGWLRRRKWGWQLAVTIIAIQIVGDVVSALRGQVVPGSVGVVVAGALLLYMTRPYVRSVFVTKPNRLS